MSPEQREIVGKTCEEVCEIRDLFGEKYWRDDGLINGGVVSLSNYKKGGARFTLCIYILQEPTPELLKSLRLPKRRFKGVPVKYIKCKDFHPFGARNQVFE